MTRRLLLGGLLLLLLAEAATTSRESRDDAGLAARRPLPPSSHRYIGELEARFPRRWNALLRGSGLHGVRLEHNVAFSLRGRGMHLTTPEGFAALSMSDATRLYARPKPAGVYRVAVLGGSTVFGTGARRPEETLPARIRAALAAAAPGRVLEVINAGIPGAASGREWLYLESVLLAYEPDLVIVYNGWNDVWTNHHLLSRTASLGPAALAHAEDDTINARLNDSVTVAGSARSLAANAGGELDLALSRSALYRRLREAVASRSRPAEKPKPALHPQAVEMYARNLERFIATARRERFKLALFLQPLLGVDGKPLSSEEAVFTDQSALHLRAPFYA